ncbi:MAG: hypothetical protein ACKOIA_00225, partial [Acidimicrobiia bacterium]
GWSRARVVRCARPCTDHAAMVDHGTHQLAQRMSLLHGLSSRLEVLLDAMEGQIELLDARFGAPGD